MRHRLRFVSFVRSSRFSRSISVALDASSMTFIYMDHFTSLISKGMKRRRAEESAFPWNTRWTISIKFAAEYQKFNIELCQSRLSLSNRSKQRGSRSVFSFICQEQTSRALHTALFKGKQTAGREHIFLFRITDSLTCEM